MALTLPSFTYGAMVITSWNSAGIWPPSRSASAGDAPLYGMCVIGTLVIRRSSSPDICVAPPMLDEP